jgi:TonB family protein
MVRAGLGVSMAEGRRAYGFGLSRDGHIAFAAAYIAVLVTIGGFGLARFVSATLPVLRLLHSIQQAAPSAPRPVAFRAHPVPDPAFPRTVNIYPRVALLNRQQGIVFMRLLVLPSGEVGDVNLVKSSGYPQLDAAAIVEAGNWRYLPAVRNWAPVSSEVEVAIRFKLTA